ncbi:MAG: DCC1-like thiol-disulfide oxidoreductase family protein [Bacteroidales bacterium]|nr:DCC1-like thiol-disulfide oxidoreductase family protein [Bacteroidales bacterium]
MTQTRIVYFDGYCNLCSGWVKFLLKRDKRNRFKFAALQSGKGQNVLKILGMPLEEPTTVIYLKNDKYFTESEAALEILKDLGGFWIAFSVFRLIPISIRNYLYGLISKWRYKLFGKRDTCMIPQPDQQKRFID